MIDAGCIVCLLIKAEDETEDRHPPFAIVERCTLAILTAISDDGFSAATLRKGLCTKHTDEADLCTREMRRNHVIRSTH